MLNPNPPTYNFRVLNTKPIAAQSVSDVLFSEFKEILNDITLQPSQSNIPTIESQIRTIQIPNSTQSQSQTLMNDPESKKKIARLYVIPELYILYSKMYQSYTLRQNFIFSYLYTFEDFYRLSQYYFSHENPNIRSINKLLRDNMKKSENLKMDSLTNILKDEFEEMKKIQTDSLSIFRNIESYLNKEENIENQKNMEIINLRDKLRNLIEKINPFMKSTSIITIPPILAGGSYKKKNSKKIRSLQGGAVELEYTLENTLPQIYQKIDLYLDSNPEKIDLAKKKIELYEIMVQLRLLDPSTENMKLEELLKLNPKTTLKMDELIQNINDIINQIQTSPSSLDNLLKLIEQFTTLYKMDDEDAKEKKMKELEEKINKISKEIEELIKKVSIFNNKIDNYIFLKSYTSNYLFILCKLITSVSIFFEKLSSTSCSEELKNKSKTMKSQYEKFKNEFSNFIRSEESTSHKNQRYLQLKYREIQKNISILKNEIKQKQEENESLKNQYPAPTPQTISTITREYNTLKRTIDDYDNYKKIKDIYDSYLGSLNPNPRPTPEQYRHISLYENRIDQLRLERDEKRAEKDKLEEQQRKHDSNKTKIQKNEASIRMNNNEKASLEQFSIFLKEKVKENKEEFDEKIKGIKERYESIHSIFSLFAKVENKTIELQKKKDELKKKNSNNRMIDAMNNDYLFKFITQKMLSVQVVKNPDGSNKLTNKGKKIYRLTVIRSIQSFRKYLPAIKRYFEEKLKYYNNREGLLSMFTLNIGAVAGLFEEGTKNLVTEAYNFEQVGKSLTNSINKEVTGVNSNKSQSTLPETKQNLSYSQSQFGMPSQQSSSIYGSPSYNAYGNPISKSLGSSIRGYSGSPYNNENNYMGRQSSSSMFGSQYGNPYRIQGGGAAPQTEQKRPEKKRELEFIKVVDKTFSELKKKVQNNSTYDNRIKTFIEYIDDKDKDITNEILRRLNLIEKTRNLQYRFILPEQVRFMIRRLFKINIFISKLNTLKTQNKNEDREKLNFIYMTDLILMYFSLQYVFLNLIMCLFKESTPLNS